MIAVQRNGAAAKGSVSELFVGSVYLNLATAAGAADLDLEAEGRDFAEGDEG